MNRYLALIFFFFVIAPVGAMLEYIVFQYIANFMVAMYLGVMLLAMAAVLIYNCVRFYRWIFRRSTSGPQV